MEKGQRFLRLKRSEGAGENLRFRGRVPTRFGWSNGSEQLLLTRTETTIRIRSWPTTSLVLVRSTSGRTHTHTVLLRIVSLRVKAIHLGSVSSAVLSRFFSCCLVSSEIGSPCIRSKLRFESSGPRSVHARNRTFSPAARQRQWSPCWCLIVYT